MTEQYPSKDRDKGSVSFELYSGTKLNLAEEKAAEERWWETGEACRPVEIGKLAISDEILQLLEGSKWGYYEMVDDLDEVNQDISPEVREILKSIWSTFTDAVNQDVSRSGLAPNSIIWDDKMSLGHFIDADDMDTPHFDYPDMLSIRYTVTIIGKPTELYGGTIPADLFDKEGTLVGDLPDTATKLIYPTLSIVRFMSSSGVHSAPKPDGKPRLFIDTTADLGGYHPVEES